MSETQRPDLASERSEILNKKSILNGFFEVDELSLRHTRRDETWSPSLDRFLLERPDAVCAVVYHVNFRALYFVRQFRVGVFQKDHGWMTEFAAGLIDPGESRDQAVRREIQEELGFKVEKAEFLMQMYTSPGIISERIFLYYIEVSEKDRVSDGGGNAHEHEDLQIFKVSVDELDLFEETHQITDAKTIIGLQWFKLNKL